MKKILFIVLAFTAFTTTAQINFKDALGSIASGSTNGSRIGSALDVIGAVVGNGSVKSEDLVGNWAYSQPAVSFQSDNFLQKAGGAAASTVIVNKIKPYYDRFGVKGVTVSFTKDGDFEIKKGALRVRGTYVQADNGSYTFNIKALGKIPAGKLTVYISGNAKKIQMTCAADRLLDFVGKVGQLTGNSTVKGVTNIVDSYKGLNIGFELTKQQ